MSTASFWEKPRGPLIIDIAGTELTAQEARQLGDARIGGVILFTRNFASRQQLRDLTLAIHRLRKAPLLICVDHEGGRVQRFREDGFTALPAMARLGECWDHDPVDAMRVATALGYVLAAELRACGVDFSFTPVLDLEYGRSEVIGGRAFHRDPRVVSTLARLVSHGLALTGMRNCGKHFPGHGYAHADSHVDLPVDERKLELILHDDVAPYVHCASPTLAAVMPAHVVYPKVDDRPAGFSSVWLRTILRDRLQFEGAIISDDLSMAGAHVVGDIHARAEAARQAGCDMALVCNAPDDVQALLKHLSWIPDDASRKRIDALFPLGAAPAWPELQDQPGYQQAKALLTHL